MPTLLAMVFLGDNLSSMLYLMFRSNESRTYIGGLGWIVH
jgi:hypothetical protein